MSTITHFPKKRNVGIWLSFLLAILLFAMPLYELLAQVMESSSYKVISDSISAGGDASSSTNYIINDTLGEVGTGNSNSASYFLHAGYWQMQESYIAISSPSDLALSSISGILGEGSEGVVSWQITTDNFAGYTTTIEASTSPALVAPSDSFDDYVPAGGNPDYDFSIATTTSEFGFSPEGSDTDARFLDNGAVCNTGSGETSGKCWDGLSTSPKTIAGKTSSNHTAGSTVDVRFRAESGSSHIQTADDYSATITVTALTL